MGSMTGRSCIVTGAAQGIGRAIGEALLDEGADVCFADLNGERAAEVAAANQARADAHGATEGLESQALVDGDRRRRLTCLDTNGASG